MIRLLTAFVETFVGTLASIALIVIGMAFMIAGSTMAAVACFVWALATVWQALRTAPPS
jgi:hypothetical protein